ncbi:peptidylprolyl isomerase [Limibacter armeniacum]|uniref:peptidylprolyl isomerase n=1 Tax=Limibacter armeniacum TaxID=466084 RepID=UPI002FE526B1
MRKFKIFISRLQVAVLLISLAACTTSKTGKQAQVIKQEPTLMTVGDREVPVSEFKYLYNKNHQNDDNAYSESSLRSYLTLFTNFKLKVEEAYAQHIDQDEEFITEFELYHKQLEEPYLTGKRFSEKLVEDTYNRLKTEVRASHILIRFPEKMENKADTLKAYQKALEVKAKVDSGEDFASLAKKYSEDPSAAVNSGDLGYFTALQMVFPFEDAAYTTPIGSVAGPVRTRFGYHLIKVLDKRDARGEVKAAHIMLKLSPELSAEEREQVKQRAEEIYVKAKAGGDWEKLCRQYSEDPGTAQKNGELPLIATGRVPEEFAAAAFALETPGDVAAPVETSFGWHIIKLIEKKPLPPLDEMREDLSARVNRDSRSQMSTAMLIDSLVVENQFVENQKVIDKAFEPLDTTLVQGKWTVPENETKLKEKSIFTIAGTPITVEAFWDYVQRHQQANQNTISQNREQLYKAFWQQSLIDYEKAHLEEKYPEYKYLLQEYHDGIMLFRVMEKEVWGRASKDEVGLQAFFESHRDHYLWGERLWATIYDAGNQVVLDKVKNALDSGRYEIFPSEIVRIKFNRDQQSLNKYLRRDLNKVVELLQSYKAMQIDLTGQYVGRESKQTADKRLVSVKNYLISKGIEAERIFENPSEKTEGVGRGYRRGGYVRLRYYSQDLDNLENNLNRESALALKVTTDTYDKGDNYIIDQVQWKEGRYTVQSDDRVSLVVVKKVIPPTPKSLKEAKGEVISDYQEFLEQQWLEELRSKYPVKVDENELLKLVSKKS